MAKQERQAPSKPGLRQGLDENRLGKRGGGAHIPSRYLLQVKPYTCVHHFLPLPTQISLAIPGGSIHGPQWISGSPAEALAKEGGEIPLPPNTCKYLLKDVFLIAMNEIDLCNDESIMFECLRLAEHGLGRVSPNPLVGCIITSGKKVVAAGYHQSFGSPHAEVEALKNLEGKIPPDATLYVNLEPCCHHGKTPPCTDAIIKAGIKKVVIGSIDPFPEVQGKGVKALESEGVQVISGVCAKECDYLNRRFFTLQEKKRPYVILKWAETADGYMARNDKSSQWISSWESRRLTHRWRSYEDAIMVGTSTAISDNPLLTVRHVSGRNPIRVLPDRTNRVPRDLHLFDRKEPTIVFTEGPNHHLHNLETIQISWGQTSLEEMLTHLGKRGVTSLIVEGGPALLRSFLENDLWDETRIFKAQIAWGEGIKAPLTPNGRSVSIDSGEDTLKVISCAGTPQILADLSGS